MTCCDHYSILEVAGHHQQFETQYEANYWNFLFDFDRDIFVLKGTFWYYVHIWHMTIYVYTNMYLTVPTDSSVVIVALKKWLPSHIHFPFACCMAVRSNTNIHLAGSQFLCGNARHHLRIVFSVMLSVLIFLSYTMGLGLGQSWAFSFMIGKLLHTHIISEYHRFMMI